MANTHESGNKKSSKDPESSGEPFDIEPVEEDAAQSNEVIGDAPDGYVRSWNPIPRLKQLLERLIPRR
jgi:hypothetical protein